MANARSEAIMTPEARLCFPALFTPKVTQSGKEKYTATLLIPKTVDITALQNIVTQTAQQQWPDQWKQIPWNNPIQDGDTAVFRSGKNVGKRKCDVYPEYAGHWAVDATKQARDRNNQVVPPPPVVDQNVQKVLDPEVVYSGCYVIANVNAWAYQNQQYGVGIGLNAVQKVRDGERLGNAAPDPETLFAPLPSAPQAPMPQAPQYNAPPAPPVQQPQAPQQYAPPVQPVTNGQVFQ